MSEPAPPPTARRAPPSASPPSPTLWAHLRVVFLLFHVVAVVMAATPSTAAALKRSAWQDPTVKAEFAAWAPRLHVTPEELADRLWTLAGRWNTARNGLLAPFRPYYQLVGMGQTWQMFVAPHTFPTRLQLQETRAGAPDEWITLFEERSPDATWMASTLSVERIRASIFRWGWPSYAGPYASACRALARHRFTEEPDTVAFRCRFARVPTRSAAQVEAGKPEKVEWLTPVVVPRPSAKPAAAGRPAP